ncbi:hypothetical protein QVD17_31763 [Tagetes erecta]|uniref:Transmembrane protein n=1 Tax=Tagetes erecta TaxID=13708 RepID=A0AAD8KAJ3_TARER|nr:hypothetical protein QVD17_31763 [Tagetes erecta]
MFSFSLTGSYVLAITIDFFIVIWGSAAAITVLESASGFKALQQSVNQSTEFRRHSFSIVCATGFGISTALWYSSVSQNSWMLVLQVGVVYLQSSLMFLMYVVANTVLYVQCKVESGEDVAVTTVEVGVSGEYVRMGVNDEDGDEVVVNGGFNYMVYLLAIVWAFLLCVRVYHSFMLFISNV